MPHDIQTPFTTMYYLYNVFALTHECTTYMYYAHKK